MVEFNKREINFLFTTIHESLQVPLEPIVNQNRQIIFNLLLVKNAENAVFEQKRIRRNQILFNHWQKNLKLTVPPESKNLKIELALLGAQSRNLLEQVQSIKINRKYIIFAAAVGDTAGLITAFYGENIRFFFRYLFKK